MIVFDRKISWLRIFFYLKGGVLPRIWKRVFAATIFAEIVTQLFERSYLDASFTFTTLPFSLIGVALGIFLGFRNNSSYDRFWEGRKLWGRMINITRTLTRQMFTLIDPAQAMGDGPEANKARTEMRKEMVFRLIAYLHAFRHHLRDERDFSESSPLLPGTEGEVLSSDPNAPIWVLHRMGERFAEFWRKGWIDPLHLPVLEQSLTTMTDIQGGCERIKKTPIPFAYTVLMHRIVGIYCFTLPFGIHEKVGHLTPLVVLMISYSFFGLDAIGDEIEEPFGKDPNDLPLTTFCNMLERECRTRIEDDNLPEPLGPVNDVLS